MKLQRFKLSNLSSKQPGFSSLVFAAALFAVSVSTMIYAATNDDPAIPSPNLSASGTLPASTDTDSSAIAPSLSLSRPLSLHISSAEISSDIVEVGLNKDGAIDVPRGNDYEKAAWYKNSPTPGQLGASIIVGHVDSYERGESIFFRLGTLELDDQIVINREDGSQAVFEVKAVRQYDRDSFPADIVYGASGKKAELRLITCAGQYDQSTGLYDQNTVVFAELKRPL